MTNKERLDLNNAKIEEITRALARKQVSPTDMLQQLVDGGNSCNRLCYQYKGTNLDFIGGLDTSNVTDMQYMFTSCSKITSLDLSNFDTSNVTSMMDMFQSCSSLTNLDVSSFNTKNVTDMGMVNMFYGCSSLTELDVTNFNTSNVTQMSGMFSGCKNLTSLDLSSFDTSSVTRMSTMFGSCTNLASLDLSSFDTSNVTNFESTFYGCAKLKSLDFYNLDTSKATTMASMFTNCRALTEISGVLDLIKGSQDSSTFNYCSALTSVTLKNIKKNLTMLYSPLNMESSINTIKELWDLTGGTSQKLTLSKTSKENIANIYVKLIDVTDEMLAQDQYAGNKKPCVVCEPTDDGAMTLTEYATSKNWSIA